MGRSPCCSKVGLRRGPWSTKEDTLLTNYIQQHGEGQWRNLPKKAGLLRCGKSCRLRWMNYLRPGIKRGNITPDEEDLITRLHSLLGNRWSLIAGRLPGRTDNEIKNHWNTHLLKKLQSAGFIHQHHHLKDHHIVPKRRRSKKSKKAKQQQQNTDREERRPPNPKTTVLYLPKPIRVSSAFSRSNSVDSLFSCGGGSSSSSSDPPPPPPPVAVDVDWPLFELDEDANFGDSQDFDFFTTGFHYIMSSHSDSHVNMLDQVYDEYLQLL